VAVPPQFSNELGMLWISGATRVHLIVGDPVAQTKPPGGLTREFAARRVDAVCVPAQVTAEDFDAFMTSAKRVQNVDGFVIAPPHKFAAPAHCDELTSSAGLLNGVNVMRRLPSGLWAGDLNEGLALIAALKVRHFEPRGARALVVGAGAAGSAVALALVQEKAAAVSIADADTKRRDELIRILGGRQANVQSATPNPGGFTLVVNASAAGMRVGDPMPVDPDKLEPNTFVADLVPSTGMTSLVMAARSRNCQTLTADQMSQPQAVILADFLLEGR
jgi:shikimate 5-dehydrogenase